MSCRPRNQVISSASIGAQNQMHLKNTEDPHQIVDKEIQGHEASILALKTRRNTFAPVSKLPPEILCRIFSFVRLPFIGQVPGRGQQSKHHMEWIKVSHVSRHWRSLAINATMLWTNPPLNSPKWAAEMLKRSQMAGLTLAINVKDMKPAIIRASLQHLVHVKHLDIQQATPSALRALLTGVPETATQLVSLCINYSPHDYARKPEDDTQYKIPRSIFRGANHLQSLQLSRIDIEWDSQLLSGLTNLALRDISSDARPTWTQFMTMLESMPSLQYLDLQRALPATDTKCDKSIHLAHLNKLTVDSSALEVELFFHHVTVPRLGNIYIGSHSSQGGPVGYSGVVSALSQSCSTKDLVDDVRRLKISQRMSRTHGLCFQAFNNAVGPGLSRFLAEPELELLFGPPIALGAADFGRHHFNNKIVADVFSGLDFVNLKELILDEGICMNSRTLVRTFGRLPKLQVVTVYDSTASDFIKALRVRADRQDNTLIPFPALRSIAMDSVSFNPYESELQVEDLQDCLMDRYERGAEVWELHLRSCISLDADGVSLLEEIVAEVDWDGHEIDGTAEEDEDPYPYSYGPSIDNWEDFADYHRIYD